MNGVLLTSAVTTVWVVIEGLIGGLGLGRKGRPYRLLVIAVHVILFLPVAAGWFYTAQGLSAVPGTHAASWISLIAMAIGIVLLLVSGVVLTAGKSGPAPIRLVLAHRVGMALGLLGGIAAVICALLGV